MGFFYLFVVCARAERKTTAREKRQQPTTQKDLRLALALGDTLAQPLPVAAAANEAFKAARALGHGDSDFAAVYEATRSPAAGGGQEAAGAGDGKRARTDEAKP